MSCEVTVAQGTLKGQVRTAYDGTKYYSFEGIPYAKPPVGPLRFKVPTYSTMLAVCWYSNLH